MRQNTTENSIYIDLFDKFHCMCVFCAKFNYDANNAWKTVLFKFVISYLVCVIIVIRTYILETRAESAVLRTYVENQAILEPILLYRASKCKKTKEQGSEDCLWTHIFTFL